MVWARDRAFDAAVEATKLGAVHYLAKPVDADAIRAARGEGPRVAHHAGHQP